MQTVQSIERALDILQVFTHQEHELGIVEICKRSGLSKGTGHRIVYTLIARGFLSQNKQNGKYSLGPRAFEVGSIALSNMEIKKVAQPYLQELREVTGETVHLVVRENMEVLYVDKVESSRTIRMSSFVGQRMPMHCTAVGKVLLAGLPITEVKNICTIKGMPGVTPRTITSFDTLAEELEKVKLQGFALDDEENEEGLRCIAAPIKDHSGDIIAAISISAPVMRLEENMVQETAEQIMKISKEVSFQMGFRKV